jgi:hypothetical protein
MSKNVGAVNAVTEDFLDEDPEIPSQKFVLLSFISPENVLQTKDKFFFQKFMTDYEIQYKGKSLEQFLGNTVLDINRKLDAAIDELVKADVPVEKIDELRATRIPVETVMDQYQAYLKKYKGDVTRTEIDEAYKDFLFRKQTELDDEFHKVNNFQTTVRGLKIRGVYATDVEASARAKKLQRSDPLHNILLGVVGKWLPWDPTPNAIQDQEYAEDQLNNLMQSYKKNEENVANFYKERGVKRPGGGPQVHGSSEASASASGSDHGSLFDQTDLVLQRKMEQLAASNENSIVAGTGALPGPASASSTKSNDGF